MKTESFSSLDLAKNGAVEASTQNRSSAGDTGVAFTAGQPTQEDGQYELRFIPVERLVPNDEQARQSQRNEETWVELVESVRRHGVKQPLLVRPLDGDGKYRVVDGHGRLAAAKEAGLKTLPCLVERALVRESEELRLQYHTNQLREGLRPLDQGRLFKRLIDLHDMTQPQVAEFLGVSQSYVSDCVQDLRRRARSVTASMKVRSARRRRSR